MVGTEVPEMAAGRGGTAGGVDEDTDGAAAEDVEAVGADIDEDGNGVVAAISAADGRSQGFGGEDMAGASARGNRRTATAQGSTKPDYAYYARMDYTKYTRIVQSKVHKV